MEKEKLGNPFVAASAVNALQNKGVQKGIKITGIALVSLGAVLIGNKLFRKAREKRFLKKYGSDKNVQVAIMIYNEIPDKAKDTGSSLNPLNILSKLWGKAKFWEYSKDSKLIEYSKMITDVSMVAKTFTILYKEDFYTIMSLTMTPEKYLEFMKNCNAQPAYVQPKVDDKIKGTYIIPKKDNVAIWQVTQISTLKYDFKKVFVKKTNYLGKATGNKQIYQGTYYIEIKLDSKNRIYYAEEKDLKFLNKADFNAILPTLTYPNLVK